MKKKLVIAGIALLFANTAHAETWIAYQATGTGFTYTQNYDRTVTTVKIPVSIALNFRVLLLGVVSVGGEYYTSDGSTFTARVPPYQTYSVTGGTSGVIHPYSRFGFPSGGLLVDGTVNYDDSDAVGGFPLGLASSQASGSLYQEFFTGGFDNAYNVVTGSFDTFRILGEVSGPGGPGVSTAPLPETATWGMMIAGFGMMGAAMRTRRRSTKDTFA